MLTIDRIKEVVSNVGKRYGIRSAHLFGSYAKNNATEASDVDLIINRDKALHTYKEFFHFCDDLETELGISVDVIVEDSVHPDFFDLIKNDRILLYGIQRRILGQTDC